MLYIDCRFIFGSAARVERLFSHCKYIKKDETNDKEAKFCSDDNYKKIKSTFVTNKNFRRKQNKKQFTQLTK